MKQLAAERAVEEIRDNMIVGLGTGSTAYWAIRKIGERVKEGLRIGAVATSLQTETMAKELDIPILPFADVESIDLTIDGADEVDQQRNLIKGGGGALMREKLIAYNSKRYFIVIDQSKRVEQLGQFPLPVEILPFGWELTLRQLQKKCSQVQIRQKEGRPFVTDNGNLIADLSAFPIKDPGRFNEELHTIPGVLETCLFPHNWVTAVVVATNAGEIQMIQ